MEEPQFYAYVRNSFFSNFCARKDPLNKKPTSELLNLFLSEVGTPFLTTKYFFKNMDREDMFYSYVPIKKGQYVRYRLTPSEYYNQSF